MGVIGSCDDQCIDLSTVDQVAKTIKDMRDLPLVGHLPRSARSAAADRGKLRTRMIGNCRQIHGVDPPTRADHAKTHGLPSGHFNSADSSVRQSRRTHCSTNRLELVSEQFNGSPAEYNTYGTGPASPSSAHASVHTFRTCPKIASAENRSSAHPGHAPPTGMRFRS